MTASDVDDFHIIQPPKDIENPLHRHTGVDKWWMRNDLQMNRRSLSRTRSAVDALKSLGLENIIAEDGTSRISEDVGLPAGSSAMPSIRESPLEQDFTTTGTPSRLDCPFASMANRRLSSHAASVVSRYKPNGVMTPRSATSRINGRIPTSKPASLLPEIDGEQCGALASPKKPPHDLEASIQGSVPVCPIRFLEKNTPEDVADYFEKHKHEIPRSHEICVKRYQSNEESIRQLDAKYGNLVSMIQGLGQKHVPMLPGKAEHDEEQHNGDGVGRVQQWADKISNEAPSPEDAQQDEDRQSHFDRPLRDVRVGESPSRPWGIQVPLSAIENAEAGLDSTDVAGQKLGGESKTIIKDPAPGNRGKCPFPHGATQPNGQPHQSNGVPDDKATGLPQTARGAEAAPKLLATPIDADLLGRSASVRFNGPVFIGYSPEQAAALIRALQDGASQKDDA